MRFYKTTRESVLKKLKPEINGGKLSKSDLKLASNLLL